MKNKLHFISYLVSAFCLASLIFSCKKDKPVPALTLTDASGNVYQTVKIGTQTWMAENLKTTKFNDGSLIPYVDVPVALSTPAFTVYGFDTDNKTTYGCLYNYLVAVDPQIAPAGWHVPTEAEWQTLIDYLGDSVGDKLKETGNTHWSLPSTNATNESGFTALPGGFIDAAGFAQSLTNYAFFWTATETDASHAQYISIAKNSANILIVPNAKTLGMSIRLVKD